MTPLLHSPRPWPPGEALPWARDRGWEGVPAVGSVAIQPVPHQVDAADVPADLRPYLPSAAIPNLIVRCRGHQTRPFWHGANGLYGFVGLPPGTHSFEIEDPLGRFLPARITLRVDDRSAIFDALLRCERPRMTEHWSGLVHRVSLRPAPSAHRSPGSTGLWGVVRQGDRPLPLALVQVATRLNPPAPRPSILGTATIWSGLDGSFRIDLGGERPDPMATPPDAFTREVVLFLPTTAAVDPSRPWIDRIPADFDRLIHALGSGTASDYERLEPSATPPGFQLRDGPSGALGTNLTVRLGQHQRWDILVH